MEMRNVYKIQGQFEKLDWQQCDAVMQMEAVTCQVVVVEVT
jgi:hypothetical protein